jgi:hypothetical protein
MSVLGISSMNSTGNEFQQLGQALKTGNMSAAKQDFAQLTQNASSTQSTSSPWSSQVFSNLAQSLKLQLATGTAGTQGAGAASSLSQGSNSLGQALQSGNLSAAQQAYSQMQQSVQDIQLNLKHNHHTALQPLQAAAGDTSSSSSGDGTNSGTTGTNFLSSALSLFSAVA